MVASSSFSSRSGLVRRGVLVAAAAALLAACGAALAWGGERVAGSGRLTTENRTLSGYTGVSLGGSFKVVLRQSGHEGVELRGDDNLLPLLETRVVDGRDGRTLELCWKEGVHVSSRSEIVVTVDVRELRDVAVAGSGTVVGDNLQVTTLGVRISGSGDVSLDKLRAADLAVSLSGSGDMRARGRSGKLSVAIAGSGDVDTDGLDADDVTVRVAGSGDASVTAHKTLSVSIAGSGDVSYRGEAQPQLSVAGSGSVKRR